MAHRSDGLPRVVADDGIDRRSYSADELGTGDLSDQICGLFWSEGIGILPRDIARMSEVELGNAIDNDGRESLRLSEWCGRFDCSLLWAHVQRVEVFWCQIVRHQLGLFVSEFGQSWVRSIFVEIDTFGAAMTNEYQLHV